MTATTTSNLHHHHSQQVTGEATVRNGTAIALVVLMATIIGAAAYQLAAAGR